MNLADASGDLELRSGGEVLLPRIRVADSFVLRSLGLMGRRGVPEAYGTGLFFPNCGTLHGFFMRFELEVWFLDAEGQPLEAPKPLMPWGVAIGPQGACHCMEISPGSLSFPSTGGWEWKKILSKSYS